MSRRKRRLTFDELEVGAVLFAGSLLLEGALLAPKKEVTLGDKTVKVSGLFALSQPYIASIGQKALNVTVPLLMSKLDETLEHYEVKETLKNKILDFLFVKLEEVSMKDAVSFVFDHSSVLDNHETTANVRDYMYDVLTMQNDREAFVSDVTERIISGLRTLTSGTFLSVLVSARFMDVLEETVTLVLQRIMATPFGTQLMDRIFDVVGLLEDQSVTSFLADTVGITEDTVSDLIDTKYNDHIGAGLKEHYEAKNYGDIFYNNLADKDYDSIWNVIMEKHQSDLINVAFTAASVGIFFYRKKMKKVKRADKKNLRLQRKAEKALTELGLDPDEILNED